MPPPRVSWEKIHAGYAIPRKPHRIIGELEIRYSDGYEKETVMRMLKKKAADAGADGLLLGHFSRAENKWVWSNQQTGTEFASVGYRLKVTMYRYLEDSP